MSDYVSCRKIPNAVRLRFHHLDDPRRRIRHDRALDAPPYQAHRGEQGLSLMLPARPRHVALVGSGLDLAQQRVNAGNPEDHQDADDEGKTTSVVMMSRSSHR